MNWRRFQTIFRDEGGMQVAEWVGMSAVVLMIIAGLWTALNGGPGRALRGTVSAQANVYANAFENGIGTRGPSGGKPCVAQTQQTCQQQAQTGGQSWWQRVVNWLSKPEVLGTVFGLLGAAVALLAAAAIGLFAGLPALVVLAIVGAALAVGALVGYVYARSTGRADFIPIVLLAFAGAAVVIAAAVGLIGLAGLAGAVAIGALVGAGLDYAIQVWGNYQRGLSGWEAWVSGINWGQVATSGLVGAVGGGVGFAVAPALAAWLGGGLAATIGAGVLSGGLAGVTAQIVANVVTGQPWQANLGPATVIGMLTGGLGAVISRAVGQLGRAMAGQNMTSIARSLDGIERTVNFRELSGWSQGVIRQLEKNGWVRVRNVPIQDLADVSKFLGREIGVLQSTFTGRIRLVLGTENGVLSSMIRPGEVFLAHTHPVFRSLTSHFNIDLANASKQIEAVVDWAGTVTYFSKSGIVNPTIPSAVGDVIQNIPTFVPAFIKDGNIVGWPTMRPFFDGFGKLIRIKVP